MAPQERALAIAKRTIGGYAPVIAQMRADLGSILRERNDLHRAREMQERSVRQLEEQLGPDHPDLARVMNELGATLLASGRHGASAEVRRHAVALVEGGTALGQGEILCGLAESLLVLGHLHEAKALVEKAISAEEELVPQNGRALGDAFDLLARILDAAGQGEVAATARRRAQALRRTFRGG
jgi:tetratricopeptide (TPR) repeat protein